MILLLKSNIEKFKRIIKVVRDGYNGYASKIFFLTFLGMINSFLEGIGVTALIPVFTLAAGKDVVGGDFISKAIRSFFGFFGFDLRLKFLLAFIILVFIFKFLVDIAANYVSASIYTKYQADTMKSLFGKMLNSSWSFLANQKVGYLDNLLSVNIKFSRLMLQEFSSLMILIIGATVYLFIAFSISASITSVTLMFGLFIFFIFRNAVKKLKGLAYDTNKYSKKIAHFINEKVVGMKTIKIFSVEDGVRQKAFEYFTELNRLQMRAYVRKKMNASILTPLSMFFVMGLFVFFFLRPGFDIAVFIVLVFLIQKIFEYIKQAQSALQNFVECLPYLENILHYDREMGLVKEDKGGDVVNTDFGDIKFDNVNFSYPSSREVLSNVNFVLPQGSMVGLVGYSGAGKTTIVDLLLQLLKPSSGKIWVGNTDINNLNLDVWRKNVGYVSQDVFIINGTVADNIRFFDKTITDDDVAEAVKLADMHEFIFSNPKGLLTELGERGTKMSVGQRQRISIARVLARHPKILVLDEATSSLDNETERNIQDVLQGLRGKMTVLIIAHRLKTVMNCEKILVIQNGNIVESGTPRELLDNPDSYFSRMNSINSLDIKKV
jgi:subfamily B ATP-binding cassette protein MsbA